MNAVSPRAVRHFEPPTTLSGWLVARRFQLARRITQLGVLLLFAGTAARIYRLDLAD